MYATTEAQYHYCMSAATDIVSKRQAFIRPTELLADSRQPAAVDLENIAAEVAAMAMLRIQRENRKPVHAVFHAWRDWMEGFKIGTGRYQ